MSAIISTTPEPLVSVLIPVYNRERYLAECIESALNQTWQNLEVVVADNASTDGTWAICQEFAAKDSRVRIFRNDSNLGPVRNWLRCMEEARGKYAKLLFSDDFMAPDFLERTLPCLQDENVGFVFSTMVVGESPGSGGKLYWWRTASRSYASDEFIKESLLGGKVPVSPGAALFRLDDLRKNLLLDIPSKAGIDFSRHGAGPDVLLYLLTASAYPQVAYLSEPLIFFRSHPDSITIREGSEIINEHYFSAKLWFAKSRTSEHSNYFGSLLQKCLAYGWLMQRRKGRSESLEAFCRRYCFDPPQITWTVVLTVKYFRTKLRVQRSLHRIFGKDPKM